MPIPVGVHARCVKMMLYDVHVGFLWVWGRSHTGHVVVVDTPHFFQVDVEDAAAVDIRRKLLEEESYCLPIGLIIGGVGGFFNHRARIDRRSGRRFKSGVTYESAVGYFVPIGRNIIALFARFT